MSEEKMQEIDAEVIRMANKTTKDIPSANHAAGTCCTEPLKGAKKEGVGGMYENAASAEEFRKALLVAIKILICILIAALFVVALVDPEFIKHLVNIGVLVCGMAAAIIADRFYRRK